ncbi:hypothetical protein K435DRAFT_798804 [Dendrothele bispora CBS 962.96]|uniref:Uncharacterized protein n=1 Tax=Dendrothele bispora (strain CBS 962.96) TaxID=1314807 RepID=A0A4S8LY35_DENBC|nr:hypothetical protein K435DRAFT_798804 [Dendrothele bispora CBS 962.96]
MANLDRPTLSQNLVRSGKRRQGGNGTGNATPNLPTIMMERLYTRPTYGMKLSWTIDQYLGLCSTHKFEGRPISQTRRHDLAVARKDFEMVNRCRRLPVCLEIFLDELRQKFYLVREDVTKHEIFVDYPDSLLTLDMGLGGWSQGAAVPADTVRGTPNPSQWGPPVAALELEGHDPIKNFVKPFNCFW